MYCLTRKGEPLFSIKIKPINAETQQALAASMAVLKILKHVNNKQHRAETQQASAATMAATDYNL